MSDLFWLTEAQLKRIEPYLSKSRGVPRVDDRRVVSGIIHVIRNGLRWRDAPAVYGPNKTLYSRFVLWSRMRIFDRIFPNLAAKNVPPDCLMIEHYSSQSPPHRRQSAQKGALPRCIGRTKGGLNSKLHAVCDGLGRPIMMLLTEGQMSDHNGAFLLLSALPRAKELLADKGYDSDWFRAALIAQGITPCIPPRKNRKVQYHYDKELYRQRHKIENVFGRIKDWRRVATRYDRCAHTFMSAISIAATVCYWL